MRTFVQRMVGAAKGEPSLYEEVEADHTATGQAMGVVVLASLANGIGSWTWGLSGLLRGIFSFLVFWYVWAYLTYFIGSKILPEPQTKADHGELLRTLGFSSAPGILLVFAAIPPLWWIVHIVAIVWMITTMITGVRQALDYESTWRAIAVCLLGLLLPSGAIFLLVLLLPKTVLGLF